MEGHLWVVVGDGPLLLEGAVADPRLGAGEGAGAEAEAEVVAAFDVC